jgi:hypothetical protein
VSGVFAEQIPVLTVLDWFLTGVHVLVVLAFVLLWIPRSTARFHGWLVLGIAFSWLGLGAFRGFGYCVLTDLQWRVKHALGVRRLPNSFLKYAGDFLTGQNLQPAMVDTIAAVAFVAVCGAACVRHWQARRASAR